MPDSISGIRDYYADYYNNSADNATSAAGGTVYNAVFTDSAKNSVSVDDFLNLMVAQLKNQDFMNPVEDTQFVTQLAQFATMTQMQEMAEYMKTNYALALIGQKVTAARFTVSGALEQETGPIEKVSIVDSQHMVTINGKQFSLSQIMEYHNGTAAQGSEGSSENTGENEQG